MIYEEINKELKSKEVYGFKFRDNWNSEMDAYIDKIGVIGELHDRHPNYTEVTFNDRSWYYPTKKLEYHLVDVEPVDLNKLFNEISKL